MPQRARSISGQDKGGSQPKGLEEQLENRPGYGSGAGTAIRPPQASDLELDPEDQAPDLTEEVRKQRVKVVVAKFLLTWLGFLIVITGVSLLANLEWARPKIQDEMTEAFHRRVRLGTLSWSLGLNGLAISTDRLSMKDADGSPFIVSGRSEIGIAFLPLFRKRVIIKHVDFHQPEVYATQVAPGKWNFSDLLVEGPEIHYVEVDDGRLHLRNVINDAQVKTSPVRSVFANTQWRSYDFENVSLKLIFPKQGQQRQWPFYLAFKLPRHTKNQSYISSVSLTLLANGTFDDWQKRRCSLELRGDHINPADWRPFLPIPPGLSGSFNFRYLGKGVMANELQGELKADSSNLAIMNNGNLIFSAPEAKYAAKVQVKPQLVSWQNASLQAGGIKVESHGQIEDWKLSNPRYQINLSADLAHLADLSSTSLWRFFPGFDKTAPKPPELKGSAVIEVNMVGDNNDQKIYTVLKARDIPLSHLLADGSNSKTPLLSLFEIEPNAPIKGQIEVTHDHRVLLKDVEIPSKGTVLKIHGFVDTQKTEHEVFVTTHLDSSNTAKVGQRETAENSPILISGKIDLDAHFKQQGAAAETQVKARLKNATLHISPKTLLADGLNGTIGYDGSNVTFTAVKGNLVGVKENSAGAFALNGLLGLNKNGRCSLKFDGNHVDISQLEAFTHSARIPVPDIYVLPMHGIARQVDIGISGPTAAPSVVLSIAPEDMSYQMAPTYDGVALKPLKITGGSINFSGNTLEFKDLTIGGQSGKLTLTAIFAGQADLLSPTSLHLKSSGIEIEEVQQYLASQTLPEQSRKAFAGLVMPLQLSSVQGRAYGDISVDLTKGPAAGLPRLDGIIGFSGATGKYGEAKQTIDHLYGSMTIAGDDVTLQDLSATFGSSRLSIQGEIKKFQTNPAWKIQAFGPVRPQELLKGLGGKHPPVDITSVGQINTRVGIVGDSHSNKVTFSARADDTDNLRVSGVYGNFYQPANTPITLDGTLTINSGDTSTMQLQNGHVVVGASVFQTSGMYSWFHDRAKTPNLEFMVATANPVPVPVLLNMVNPSASKEGAAGTVKLTFAVAGPTDQLLTHGDITMTDVALPDLNVTNLNGRIHTPRWSIVQSKGGTDSARDTMRSEARIDLNSLNVGAVPIRDLYADILVENTDEPRISITDGTAAVAGGKVNINASYYTQSCKWHLDLGMQQLQVDEFVTDLIEHSGAITGLADGKIVLDSSGTTTKEAVSNLQGHGNIAIYKGTVPKVGQLQEKLTQANLLQQGIFGFNLNNVFQSVLPVKSGQFSEASMSFDISSGIVNMDNLDFEGSDLRLRAAGAWNIPLNTVSMDVAGNIPRVASSILPGAVGEVSRNFTIQKAVRVMTFRKLENLPSLPILGDLGTDEPRAFAFKVAGSGGTPDSLTKSIQKTFHWLPNKPNASAHPIPGMGL